MKFFSLLFFSIFILFGCQDYNSNSSDKLKYGGSTLDDGGDPNFLPAYQIIQSKCIACHEGRHNSWLSLNGPQWASNTDLISKGNPDSSPLIMATANWGGSMPPIGYSNLTNEEYQILRNWITNMP